jgi:(p)ppGpp synthase/HD superfamily hydrolase
MNRVSRGDVMIDLAIEVAVKAHEDQLRKGTDIPYISHPLAVGILLAKAGCPDEVIAAGILHDTVEDTSITLGNLREAFGERVAAIVKGASEPDRSLPWEERKAHTVEFLKTASLEVRLVTCADKLHNIRTIASEYEKIGDQVWKRFKRGKEDQAWYYLGVVKSVCDRSDNLGYESLFQQLKSEVEGFFGKT